jgi:RNA polymerase sigma-70 factor, ECF subfamily
VELALEHRLLHQVKQCPQDSYAAFEQLQVLLEMPVRRFIRRLVGNIDAEDDIVQEVFIAFFYNMQRIDPVENLRPYLFRIVRNAVYDELRAQGRFKSVSLDDEETEHVWLSLTKADDIESQPEEVAHWLLLHLEVKEAIDRMPELQRQTLRQTLILYSDEQLSYAEIALAMDTNIGTVKSRLFHAKKLLRQMLRPETLQALEENSRTGDS